MIQGRFSPLGPRGPRLLVWSAIIIVFVISFSALVGWIFNITLLTSIKSQWVTIRVVTAICLALLAIGLALLQWRPSGLRRSIVLHIPGILVGLVGLLTIAAYATKMFTGQESSLANTPFLNLFLAPEARMALLTAIIFLIMGCALVLFTTGGRRAAHVAHAIMVPAAIASYLVAVSYLLSVEALHGWYDVPVALHTGIAFCALSIAIFCVRPDTWLMRVFTGRYAGSTMARRLLPGLLLIPVLIGWLRLYGERTGAFESEVGVVLVALAYTLCLVWLVWTTARSLNETDDKGRQIDETLQKERDFVSAVLDTLGAIVVVLDKRGRITRFNRACEEITGYSASEALGRVFWEFLVPPEELPGVKESWEALKTGDFPNAHENHWLAKDGSRRLVAWSNTVLTGEAGDVLYVIGTGIDITGQREAEKELLRAKESWERTFASVPDLIAILDNKYQILRINNAMARRLGVKAEDAIGHPCYEVIHGLSEPPDYCPHSRTIKDGRQHVEEMRVDRLRGYFVVSTTPLHDDRGQMVGTVHVAHDITDRKMAQDALQRAHNDLELRVQERTAELSQAYEALQHEMDERAQVEEKLRQAHKMQAIGTLAGGIAHDFNNILAAIIGFSEMVEEDIPEGSPIQSYIQRILSASFRGRDLVKQILTFSRKAELPRQPVSVLPIIQETIQLLRASLPTTIEIKLITKATTDTIQAAPAEVQQILMNLATNAAMAMREHGGILHISLSDIDFEPDSPVEDPGVEPGEYLQIVVEDSGSGMSPDIMKRVFEPFFTTRLVGEGTGMGLAVVYGIVKSLHGTITVESEPRVGSTFRVFLPKVRTETESEPAQPDQNPRGTERVLFVDDEELLMEWGKAALERLGYTVTALTDSAEALKLFSSDPSQFDLIITDQTMPGIPGLQLSKELLKIRPDIPIILCTGHSDTVSPEMAKEAGIREFLMKPLAKQELAQVIRRVLDAKV